MKCDHKEHELRRNCVFIYVVKSMCRADTQQMAVAAFQQHFRLNAPRKRCDRVKFARETALRSQYGLREKKKFDISGNTLSHFLIEI